MPYTFPVYRTPPARAAALLRLLQEAVARRYRTGEAPHTALVNDDFRDEQNKGGLGSVVSHSLDFAPVTGGSVPAAVIKAAAYLAALNAHLADGEFAHPGGADVVATPISPTLLAVTAGNLQTAVQAGKDALNAHLANAAPHYVLPVTNTLATIVISNDATAITSLNEQLALYERHINRAEVYPTDAGT